MSSKEFNEFNIFNLIEPYKTTWKTDINKSTIIKQIKRPRLITFTSDIDLEDISNYGLKERNHQKISLLKSNIQKAVRRNKPDIAVSSASELIKYKTGLTELLRRLCIIIVEDKFSCYEQIANHYNVLVWMMAAEKAWPGWLNWVLGLLHFICDKRFKYVDNLIELEIDYNWTNNPYSHALLIRAFYGGMKCDMILLKNCAKVIEKMNPADLDRNTVEIKLIEPNNELKIIKGALDFHCVPGIIKHVLKKHPNYTEVDVKKAIWDYSSSIRFDCEKNVPNDLWNDIHKTVSDFQRWYICILKF